MSDAVYKLQDAVYDFCRVEVLSAEKRLKRVAALRSRVAAAKIDPCDAPDALRAR
ncbi:MAG: hypothetical protein ACI8S6_004940 [Myxococcota bacterium]